MSLMRHKKMIINAKIPKGIFKIRVLKEAPYRKKLLDRLRSQLK